jgi:hypothetical protein
MSSPTRKNEEALRERFKTSKKRSDSQVELNTYDFDEDAPQRKFNLAVIIFTIFLIISIYGVWFSSSRRHSAKKLKLHISTHGLQEQKHLEIKAGSLSIIPGSDSERPRSIIGNKHVDHHSPTEINKELQEDFILEEQNHKKNDKLCVEKYSISNNSLYYIKFDTTEISWNLPKDCKIKYLEKPYFITASHMLITHQLSLFPSSTSGEFVTRTKEEALIKASEYRDLIVSKSRSFQEIADIVHYSKFPIDVGFLGDIERSTLGLLDHIVEVEAFSLAEETISRPIESNLGIHLIMRHKDGYRIEKAVRGKTLSYSRF